MIERVSAVQQSEAYLLEYIAQESTQVGCKLPTEQQLCKTLGVGRGTVREAVRLLQAKGYVEIRPGRGAFVAQKEEPKKEEISGWFRVNEANIKDINDVRFAIEPFAVMRAVENCTPRDLMQLHAIQARSIVAAEQKDAPILALCDEQFHTYIFECAKNPLLLDINKRVVAQLAVFRSKTFTIPDNVQNFIPAHAAVLEAFEKRDPELGKFMMERHLKTVAADLEASKNISESLDACGQHARMGT